MKQVKKSKKTILLWKSVFFMFITLLISFFTLRSILGLNEPTMKLMFGLYNYIKDDEAVSMTDVSFNSDLSAYYFLDHLNFNLSTGKSSEGFSTQLITTYNNDVVLDLNIFSDDSNRYVSSDSLFKMTFVSEREKSNYQDFVTLYGKKFKIEGVDFKKYMSLFSEALEHSIKNAGSDVILTLNWEEFVNVISDVSSIAKEDETLKEGLQTALINLLNQVIEDGYETDDFSHSDWMKMKKSIENKKQFESLYVLTLENLDFLINMFLEYSNLNEFNQESTFIFKFKFYQLQKIEILTHINDVEINIISDLTKGYNNAFIFENPIRISDEPQLEKLKIYTLISRRLYKNVVNHQALKEGVLYMLDQYSFDFITNDLLEMIINLLNAE